MEVTITIGPEFKREFKRLSKKYHSLLDDLELWKKDIINNPFLGDDLGSGIRKVRMALLQKVKERVGVLVY